MPEQKSATLRWGILGASKFARYQMAPAIQLAENAVFAGLASSSPEKAKTFQALAPGLRLYDTYEALLDAPDIDAVYIPLPNHLHVEWTIRALEAGKAVLTEKPIALAEEEFDQLIEARNRSGLLAAEAYMILHHPQWHKVRELIAGGAVGPVRHVSGVFTYNNAASPGNIRNKPETGGGGLRDIGVYPFGAARYVLGGEPDRVKAEIVWENGVDVVANVFAAFGEVTFDALVSMRMHLTQSMTFFGETGRLTVHAPFNPVSYGHARVSLDTPDGEQGWNFGDDMHYVNQVEAFGRSVRDGAPYPVPLEFSRGTQRMLDLAFASAGESR